MVHDYIVCIHDKVERAAVDDDTWKRVQRVHALWARLRDASSLGNTSSDRGRVHCVQVGGATSDEPGRPAAMGQESMACGPKGVRWNLRERRAPDAVQLQMGWHGRCGVARGHLEIRVREEGCVVF
jgi:hypothetical protein